MEKEFLAVNMEMDGLDSAFIVKAESLEEAYKKAVIAEDALDSWTTMDHFQDSTLDGFYWKLGGVTVEVAHGTEPVRWSKDIALDTIQTMYPEFEEFLHHYIDLPESERAVLEYCEVPKELYFSVCRQQSGNAIKVVELSSVERID